MIITKKEFKDTVKEIIIEAINNTRQENITEEENAEANKKLATMLTDYYEKVIRKIFCEDCWTYSKDELANVSALILTDRYLNNPETLVFLENLACSTTVGLLIDMLEEKMQEEEPQEEVQEKEFDVEEILKEAKERE